MTNRNKAVLWIVLVFVVGSLFGSATTYFLIAPPVEARMDRRPASDEAKPNQRGRFMQILTKELTLTEEQQVRVRSILESSRDRYRAISKEADQKSSEVLKETHHLLKLEFTPEQQEKFREFIERNEKKRPPHR